jgi:hypothetical protein
VEFTYDLRGIYVYFSLVWGREINSAAEAGAVARIIKAVIMVRKRWMRWRGGEGIRRARVEGKQPHTQLLRYSYLEQTTRNSN